MGQYLYKVVVVGDWATGKSNILKRLCEGGFASVYKLTIGTDWVPKTFDFKNEGDEIDVVNLQLWDIAGHERFGAMTPVYYKYATAAVFVIDAQRHSPTYDGIHKWYEDIEAKLEDFEQFPKIFIINKIDLAAAKNFDFETVRAELQEKYQPDAIYAYSAKDDYGYLLTEDRPNPFTEDQSNPDQASSRIQIDDIIRPLAEKLMLREKNGESNESTDKANPKSSPSSSNSTSSNARNKQSDKQKVIALKQTYRNNRGSPYRAGLIFGFGIFGYNSYDDCTETLNKRDREHRQKQKTGASSITLNAMRKSPNACQDGVTSDPPDFINLVLVQIAS